jgi:hypothetical protein
MKYGLVNIKRLLRTIAFDDRFAVKRYNCYPPHYTTPPSCTCVPSHLQLQHKHTYEQTLIRSLHRQDPAPITIQTSLAPAMNHGKAVPCTHSVPAPRPTQGPAITYRTGAKTEMFVERSYKSRSTVNPTADWAAMDSAEQYAKSDLPTYPPKPRTEPRNRVKSDHTIRHRTAHDTLDF